MHLEPGVLLILSIVAALFIGALTRYLLKRSPIPYTVALLIIGLGIGLVERYGFNAEGESHFHQSLDLVTLLDPHLILFVFLPILIFESAFSLEVHLFRRIFGQILVLAVPGLIVSTFATAAFVMFLLPVDWTWPVALLFGALISATDPVAVVALLKEICSRKRLETLIEGESLLNDGTAIVLFTLFLGIIAADNGSQDFLAISGNFLWVVCLGLAIGLVVGGLSLVWIGRIFNDPLLEICISIGTAYLVYFIAEYIFHASGVVSLVTAAILFAGIGRTQISTEVAGFMHHLWEVMAYVANTLIFLLVGILIAKRLDFEPTSLWISLVALYFGLQFIRAGSISLFLPLLKRIGIGINREKTLVLIWGGLRGAVALALALSLVQGDLLAPTIADEILFLCAGIVVLTLFLNATTMAWLLRKLGLDKLPPAKQATVDKAHHQMQNDLNAYIPELEKDEFLQNADWSAIREEFSSQMESQLSGSTEEDLMIAFERRLLEAERKYYWIQYHDGLIDKDATHHLVESVELALDGTPTVYPREKLAEYWQLPPVSRWTSKFKLLNHLIVDLYYRKMSLGYEITCGFIRAQREIETYLEKLAPNAESADQVRQKIQMNIQDAHERTNLIRQVFPEVIRELETSAAKCLLLRRKRSIVRKLLDHAVLDKPEAQKLIDEIESEMARHQSTHTKFELPSVREVISATEALADLDEYLIEKLSSIAAHRVYSAGDSIFHFGDNSGSIAFLVRGAAETIPPFGEQHRIINEGEWLGTEALTQGGLKFSVIAKSPVDCVWIPGNQLKDLLKISPELKQRLIEKP